VRLLDTDIQTREVLGWKGVHVFHAHLSSCSQKLRIFLNCKDIPWHSHPIDLGKVENLSPFYMGINPRGLVPCLVHDGQVHIESNDIILHLERAFPIPRLIPVGEEGNIASPLKHEDDLHLDMRNVTFRFLFPPSPKPRMSSNALTRYATTGSGTVLGKKDPHIGREIAYWADFEAHGILDGAVQQSVRRLRGAFAEIDKTLASRSYIGGSDLSVLDIAWFVYVHRLTLGGYPLARLHASLNEWYQRLGMLPQIAREVTIPADLVGPIMARQAALRASAQDLESICHL
jgi:glutathione S-transferase